MRSPDQHRATAVPRVNGLRCAIVAAQFHAAMTARLLEAAQRVLADACGNEGVCRVVRVPGAFEIPLAAKHLAESGRYDGILCLGCVVRGDTPHFDHICRECAGGIQQVALATGLPVIFGVLTVENMTQAEERAGGCFGNVGEQGARTLIEMVGAIKKIKLEVTSDHRPSTID